MKTITSKDNPIYKSAAKLTRKKYRDETGLYLLEGVKPLEDALALDVEIRQVFLCQGVASTDRFPEDRCLLLEEKLFRQLSDTETSQGVIAVAVQRRYDVEQFAQAVAEGKGNLVVLDRLQDPGNIGTIIRTAEAAGYGGVLAIRGTGDVYGPKVVRAAAGSLLRMPILWADSDTQAVELLRQMDKTIVVSSLEKAADYREADLTSNIGLVIGNEGSGVSRELIECADVRVGIPMEGSIESLNAAVAAGILMYQSQTIN